MARTLREITEEMRLYANSKGLSIKDHIINPVAMTTLETSAHQVELLENMIEDIRAHFFIDDTPDEYLDKRLAEKGLPPRYEGEYASGNVIAIKSSPFIVGSTIYKDTILKTTDGKVEVIVTADTSIAVGSTETAIPVQCSKAGNAGNLLPYTELIYSGVAIPEVEILKVGAEGLSGGIDAETADEIRDRLREDNQKKATSNNRYQCVKWAKEIEGVGEAMCIPLWNGNNTAKVIIVNKNMLPASPELVQAVQEYIDPGIGGLGDGAAGIGLFVTVVAADVLQVTISASLDLEAGYELEQVLPAIEHNIAEYLKSLAFKENTIRYNHIGDIIYNTKGVLDHANLTINGGASNIAIPLASVPIQGDHIWTT